MRHSVNAKSSDISTCWKAELLGRGDSQPSAVNCAARWRRVRCAPRHALDCSDRFRMDVTSFVMKTGTKWIHYCSYSACRSAGSWLRRGPRREYLDLGGPRERYARFCKSTTTFRPAAKTITTPIALYSLDALAAAGAAVEAWARRGHRAALLQCVH